MSKANLIGKKYIKRKVLKRFRGQKKLHLLQLIFLVTFIFKIKKDDPIIDVGGGESKFVDYLD